MDEPPAKETPDQGLNKIDLSQLQDFRFGTQWTEIKSIPGSRREREPGSRRDGPDRGEGRPPTAPGADPRRDRRGFRRPAGPAADLTPSGARPERPAFERDDRGRPPGEWRRREGPREGRGPAREGGGERRWSGPRPPMDPRPYQSPFFNVAFYPEDAGFAALVKAMRASARTFELFEIARLILGKNERFVVVVNRRPPEAPPVPAGAAPGPAESVPPAATPVAAPAAAPTPRTAGPLHLALPDGVPFETEEAALAHAIGKHLDKFFDLAAVEVEPPKGNFPFVNRCTLSGELLGPPNYHRYAQIVQQHHALRYPRMSFERFREHIETVRDPEAVNQWLEQMKRATRYTWKPAAEGEAAVAFDNLDDARAHLLATAKARVVKAVESARFHGKVVESIPPGEIRRAIEGQLERQRRFPLDTANALRGRLRREGFTIFKKGAKGISYVCAVKRKFRVPGQSFAQGISALITFLEANPLITVKDLPAKFLGITPPPAASTPSMPPLSMSTPPIPPGPSPAEGPAPSPVAETAGPPAVATASPGGAESSPPATANQPPEIQPASPDAAEPTPASPALSNIEGPALSSVEGPALSNVEGPALSNVEGPAPSSVEGPAPNGAEGAPPAAETPAPVPAPAPVAPATPSLTSEEQDRLRRLNMDLRWLVQEGYVTEFADGRLFAPPPIAESKPRAADSDDADEHDLESFPEAAAAEPIGDAAPSAPAAAAEPTEPAGDLAGAAALPDAPPPEPASAEPAPSGSPAAEPDGPATPAS